VPVTPAYQLPYPSEGDAIRRCHPVLTSGAAVTRVTDVTEFWRFADEKPPPAAVRLPVSA
jgi:hypothetical protein